MATFDPSRQGKYRVQVGDSLLESGNPRTFASIRYNCAPSDDLDVSNLKLEEDGNFSLTLDGAGQETKYSGVQRPGRKLECLLVYNPATNSFSLEKVDSTFTFNQTHPATSEPEIPIFAPADLLDNNSNKDKDNKERDESPAGSDDEVNLADAENPFDVRHFLKLVKESDSESEAEESEKGDEMDEDEADEDVEMTPLPQPAVKEPSPVREPTPPPAAPVERRAPPAPAAGLPTKKALPRKKKEAANPFMKPTRRVAGAKSPNAGASPATRPGATSNAASSKAKDSSMSPQSTLPSPAHAAPISLGRMGKKDESSSESESDEDSEEDESDEDTRPSRPSAPISRSPAVHHKEASRPVSSFLGNRNEPEELDLGPTLSRGNQNNADADDESDEDAEDEDGLDLLAEMEAAFEGGDDGGLVIEGETDAPKGIGLGIGGIGSVGSGQAPISINGMMGNSSRRDESEESSSEEE